MRSCGCCGWTTAGISGPESETSSLLLATVHDADNPTIAPWLETDEDNGADETFNVNTFGDMVVDAMACAVQSSTA
jgi:hypothetical protein